MADMAPVHPEWRDSPILKAALDGDLVDDGPGKTVGNIKYIGRRPIIAVGNSDGELEMLQYATSGDGPSLGIYIHHDDGDREYAYDVDSTIGGLDEGLKEAAQRDWIVVSMRDDWKQIFV